ncbi:unnamed protein product [Camellia sinensis]
MLEALHNNMEHIIGRWICKEERHGSVLQMVYAFVVAANEILRKQARRLNLVVVTLLFLVKGSAFSQGNQEDDSIYSTLLDMDRESDTTGFVVVETNFRMYARSSSKLHCEFLCLFSRLLRMLEALHNNMEVYAFVVAANEILRKHAQRLKLVIVTLLFPVKGSAFSQGNQEDDSIYNTLLDMDTESDTIVSRNALPQ